MKNLNFFYRVDKQGYPVPGSLQRFEVKPTNGRWKQLDYNNICCIPADPLEGVSERTITFTYLTPLPGISYRVYLIGEGVQGTFTTSVLDEDNTTASLTIPDTGLWTVILEVISGSGGCTMTLSNSGIVGFKPIDTAIAYASHNRDLTGANVTVMNSVTPCV